MLVLTLQFVILNLRRIWYYLGFDVLTPDSSQAQNDTFKTLNKPFNNQIQNAD
jgi:hypothetical protein